MDTKEVLKLIGEKIKAAQSLVDEAVALADEHHVPFDVNFGGRGMGGYYDPDDREDQWGCNNDGWHASSQSC